MEGLPRKIEAFTNALKPIEQLEHVKEVRQRGLIVGIELEQEVATHTPYRPNEDRKSTRLNSSHANISYAVFCLKKKKYILTMFLVSTLTTYRFTFPLCLHTTPSPTHSIPD